MYSSTLFLASALEGGERSASCPGRNLPTGKTRYPLYRRLGGPQGRSGEVRKISPPPGFDPRTVRPVSSRYTDYATRPTYSHSSQNKNKGYSHKVHNNVFKIDKTQHTHTQNKLRLTPLKVKINKWTKFAYVNRQ